MRPEGAPVVFRADVPEESLAGFEVHDLYLFPDYIERWHAGLDGWWLSAVEHEPPVRPGGVGVTRWHGVWMGAPGGKWPRVFVDLFSDGTVFVNAPRAQNNDGVSKTSIMEAFVRDHGGGTVFFNGDPFSGK